MRKINLYCPKCGERCKVDAVEEICPMSFDVRCVWCDTEWTVKIELRENPQD